MADTLPHYPTDDQGRIEFWTNQIKLAVDYVEPYMLAGKRVVDLYNNRPHGFREKDLETLGPDNVQRVKGSLVFAWVDQSKANMIERNPEFSVTPETSASKGGVDVVQRVSNYWYDLTNQVEQDDQMALDAFLLPYAVKKIGWTSVIENQGDVFVSDAGDTVIDDPEIENIAIMNGTLTRPTIWQDHEHHIDTHQALLETPQLSPIIAEVLEDHNRHHKELMNMEQPDVDTRVRWEAPFGSRWAPDDFAMDPFAPMNGKNARWQAWRIRAPLYWWKRQPSFSNMDDLRSGGRLSLVGDDKKSLFGQVQNSGFDDYSMVEGWEIWARDFPVGPRKSRNLICVIVNGHDKLARHDEEWPYKFLDDYSGVLLKFQDNVKTWINRPTLTLAGADNVQQLINEFFDSMLYTMRKSKNLWLYDSDLLNKDEVEEILNAGDGSVYGVAGLSTKETSPVTPLPFLDIQQDRVTMMNQLMNFFDRTAGTPQPIRNTSPQTATETAVIERRNTAREDQRVQRFEHMQIETVEKFWRLHQQFLPEREFLIDPRTNRFAEVTEEIARGDYRFRFDISPRRQSKAVERKNWLDLYNILVGSIPAHLNLGMQPPNIVKALELLLRRGFDIRDPETLLPASAGEFMEQMQATLGDPEKVARTIEAFRTLSGGGDFGPLGGNQVLNPQQLSQPPTEAANQATDAERAA